MSTSGRFTSDRESRERRPLRADIARQRVADGSAAAVAETRFPAVVTQRSGRYSTGSGSPTSDVDPALAPGTAYGVWRSAGHFLVNDSLPDAVGTDFDRVVRWSGAIMAFRLRSRLVARMDAAGVWRPVAYARDGVPQTITVAQAEALGRSRTDGSALVGAHGVPGPGDHPEATRSL